MTSGDPVVRSNAAASVFRGPACILTDGAVVEPGHERQLMSVAAVVDVQFDVVDRHVERTVPTPSHLPPKLVRRRRVGLEIFQLPDQQHLSRTPTTTGDEVLPS